MNTGSCASLGDLTLIMSTATVAAPAPSSRPAVPVPKSLVVVVDVTPMLPGGGNGGAKWAVLSLIKQFLRQRPKWCWWLLTTAANDGFLGEMFPTAHRLRLIDEHGHLITSPKLLELPDGGRADLLFCPFTAPFHAIPAVPTVSTVYDLQFMAYSQFFTPAEVEERSRHFSQAATLCDRLICISGHVAEEVRRVTGLDEHRVRFIHLTMGDRLPAVNPDTAAAALAGLGLKTGRYLLYPANTWPHKNHAMLITAAGMYFAAHPESDLKIVCTGVSDDGRGRALRDAAVRMGLARRVLFPGFQDEQCFAALMSNARALIFPSLFEGFGIPVLEAMVNGVPVLSANTTSLPEVAGDAALMFDPRRPRQIVSAIDSIESDPELGRRLAAAGRLRAASLGTAATMAAGYLEIFAETLAERHRLSGQLYQQELTLRHWLANHPMVAAVFRLPHRVRGRLRSLLTRLGDAPGRLLGQAQRGRAVLSRRLPVLRLAMGRLRQVCARLPEAPGRLFGQLQRGRAALSRRLPVLRLAMGRLRRLFSGTRP